MQKELEYESNIANNYICEKKKYSIDRHILNFLI